MSAVGTPTRRLEGRDKVVGATRYTADLDVGGLLHVQLVLSHVASGRIRSIETSAARTLPGVVDVVVAGDLPKQDVAGPDQPLAAVRVFYVGQPVAAVIATSEAAAHDGAAAVEVDFEETAAVADAVTAMQDSAPVVLDVQEEPDEGDASMHGAAAGNESEPVERPRNVSAVASAKRGDASATMAASDVTVKARYSVAAVHHTAMEPHVSTVRPEPGGGLTVWSPTQGPFALRDELADKLDIPAHKIRVVPMPVGGGFGGKVSLLEGLLALLAIRANRPRRLVRRHHELVPRRHVSLARGGHHRLRGVDQQDARRGVPRAGSAPDLFRPRIRDGRAGAEVEHGPNRAALAQRGARGRHGRAGR